MGKGDIRLVQTSLLGTNVFFCHVSTSCPEIVTQSVAAKQFFGFSQLLGSMRKNSVFFYHSILLYNVHRNWYRI